jgi:hypothetical protein
MDQELALLMGDDEGDDRYQRGKNPSRTGKRLRQEKFAIKNKNRMEMQVLIDSV